MVRIERSKTHWLIGLAKNNSGGSESLAVELALIEDSKLGLAGHVREDGLYYFTHHCASRTCADCDFDYKGYDIIGCACNDRNSRSDCNHTVSRIPAGLEGSLVNNIFNKLCKNR